MTNNPRPMQDLLKKKIDEIRNCIVNGPPYCHGTVSVPGSDLSLFYGTEGSAHRLNFPNLTVAPLEHLAERCQPATFGLDQKDVLDETYRKAGKLDIDDFALKLDPARVGILDAVHSELAIDRLVREDAIRAELYKLNVYGPGSFFKPHVDTPRSELQFGSLVIVLPTAHEGGALKIRYAEDGSETSSKEKREEWTFDSSALLAGCTEPTIAYVAFFSDIEHEVMPVTSGYRVTITYNLYWADSKGDSSTSAIPRPISTTESTLKATMQRLLEDPDFLPNGGHLMFGLAHQYPLAPTASDQAEEGRQALRAVASRLKANDAVILRIMQELSLSASLKILYTHTDKYDRVPNHVACDRVIPLDRAGHVRTPLWETLCTRWGGMLVSRPTYYDTGCPPITRVQWVKGAPPYTDHKTTFMAYGNEATVDFVYWRIYLLVRVGPAGDRSGEPRVVEEEDSNDDDQMPEEWV